MPLADSRNGAARAVLRALADVITAPAGERAPHVLALMRTLQALPDQPGQEQLLGVMAQLPPYLQDMVGQPLMVIQTADDAPCNVQ